LFSDYTTTVLPALRLGIRSDAGIQYHVSESFFVRLTGGYSLGNLIGPSFTQPEAKPSGFVPESELNDGSNPNDASDNGRSISSWTIRLGLGLNL
jgi:hypothetical protein